MNRIQRLDPLVINQIAAGEVVERPASVIKELVENSLDAGAKAIRVRIDGGGKKLIEVSDDGDGIFEADLKLAISQHATSKIIETDDLHHVASLGFRGEALASISAVSKFIIISKPEAQEFAVKLKVKGRESMMEESPDAHPKGTTVRVYDLFFNVPARKKFLKQDKTEALVAEECVRRLALAHPSVRFEFVADGEPKLFFPACQGQDALAARVRRLMGKRFYDAARSLEIEEAGYRITGWFAKPSYTRSQTDQQYTFLNGRHIRDKVLQHAIRQAYEDAVHPGRYPAYALFIECDPARVDVNVHPMKLEVRFEDPRELHDLIVSRIRHLLQPVGKVRHVETESLGDAGYAAPAIQHAIEFENTGDLRDKQAVPMAAQALSLERHRVITHGTTLYILDLRRFWQKYFYEKLMASDPIGCEPLLFPSRGEANLACFERLERDSEALHSAGFTFDRLSKDTFLLRTVPRCDASIDSEVFCRRIPALLADKTPSRGKILEAYLDGLELDEALMDEARLLECIACDPSLPKIAIDLERFEVLA